MVNKKFWLGRHRCPIPAKLGGGRRQNRGKREEKSGQQSEKSTSVSVAVWLWEEWGGGGGWGRGGTSWCAAFYPKRPECKFLAPTSLRHFQMRCLSLILKFVLITVCHRIHPLCIMANHVFPRRTGSSQSLIHWLQGDIGNGPLSSQRPRYPVKRKEKGRGWTTARTWNVLAIYYSVYLGATAHVNVSIFTKNTLKTWDGATSFESIWCLKITKDAYLKRGIQIK